MEGVAGSRARRPRLLTVNVSATIAAKLEVYPAATTAKPSTNQRRNHEPECPELAILRERGFRSAYCRHCRDREAANRAPPGGERFRRLSHGVFQGRNALGVLRRQPQRVHLHRRERRGTRPGWFEARGTKGSARSSHHARAGRSLLPCDDGPAHLWATRRRADHAVGATRKIVRLGQQPGHRSNEVLGSDSLDAFGFPRG